MSPDKPWDAWESIQRGVKQAANGEAVRRDDYLIAPVARPMIGWPHDMDVCPEHDFPRDLCECHE